MAAAATTASSWRLRNLQVFCVRNERPQAMALLQEHPDLLNEKSTITFEAIPGWNVGRAVHRGDTPLISASMCSGDIFDPELVLALVKLGADVNARNSHNWDALTCASCYGHLAIVEILLENGANVNPPALSSSSNKKKFSTALHWAARKSHLDVCLALLRRGADLMAMNAGGLNALQQYAADRPSWQVPAVDFKVCRDKLLATYRAGPHPEQVKRRKDESWAPRWPLMNIVVGHGFRPLAYKLKILQDNAKEAGTAIALPSVEIDTPEKKAAHNLGLVLSNDGLLRHIVSYL